MKYLANENIPLSSYRILMLKGWDIKHVGEENVGISDEAVMELAKSEGRIIIAFDSDYGELVFRLGYKPPGVIYFRIQNFRPDEPAHILIELIEEKELEVNQLFTVIDESQIRQRRM